MRIDHPSCGQVPQLQRLWQLAFGDSPESIRLFFTTAYAPHRCRCITADGDPAAVLYWLDVTCRDQKMAYLYAVATHPDFRGRGLCRRLMEDTHAHLKSLGYTAALLVPGKPELRAMYAKMGYKNCGGIREYAATAAEAVPLTRISREEYAHFRRKYLPEGSVLQEKENLRYLETFARFYAGPDLLLAAAVTSEGLHGLELLGNASAAPGILAALRCQTGTFRTPGEAPFAMFLPLTEGIRPPAYFGLAFD